VSPLGIGGLPVSSSRFVGHSVSLPVVGSWGSWFSMASSMKVGRCLIWPFARGKVGQ